MKPLLAMMALGSALIFSGRARAESFSMRLTREKTGDSLYSFAIKVARGESNQMGEYLNVRVTVKAKPGRTDPLPHREGTLSVYAGKEFVSSCDVQAAENAGELTYVFTVSARHAEKTTFMYSESNSKIGGYHYWFTVADFIDPEKPDGVPEKKNPAPKPVFTATVTDDDILIALLTKSDLVVFGEIVEEPVGMSKELGTICYSFEFKITEVLRGQKPAANPLKLHMVRQEVLKEDTLPDLKKGGRCVLFLKVVGAGNR